MSRKSRGAESQTLAAAKFKATLYPYATDAGAGRNGVDVLNTDGLAVEVKARKGFSPLAWVRQAVAQAADGDLPVVVIRPDGMGPATVDSWPVMLRFADLINLLAEAGYGDRK